MIPELSQRIALCLDKINEIVGLDERLKFLARNADMELFEEMTPKDQELVMRAENGDKVPFVTDPQTVVNQISASDYPSLYEDLDIDMDSLGCIMMNTVMIPVAQYVNNPDADIYTEGEHTSGLVGEIEPHVTLLFGLLENGNIWRDKVNTVLQEWKLPYVIIEKVSFFDLGDSYAVIGLVEKTPEIIDGHERLTLLPHINTFSEYHPHITLAYIKHEADVEKWVKALGKIYDGQKISTLGLNYGDLPKITTDEVACDDETDYDYDDEEYNSSTSPVGASESHDCSEHEHVANSTLEKAKNALDPAIQTRVVLQETNLLLAAQRIEADMTNLVISKVQNGDYKDSGDLITASEEEGFRSELKILLAGFFLTLMPIYAKQLLDSRVGQYGKQGIFGMTEDVTKYIDESATNASASHVSTVIKDLKGAIETVQAGIIEDALVESVRLRVEARDVSFLDKLPPNPNIEDILKAVKEGKFDSSAIYKKARDLAREGNGLDATTRALRKEYATISKNRAKTIARHETNRVFNMSQYQADLQFLTESGLMANAYKQLRNRANDPCPICEKLIFDSRANPIPFQQNFADLGSELTATYQKANGKMAVIKMPINYEAIQAGNVHVNCRCEYELVVKGENGAWLNSVDLRINNKSGYVTNAGVGNPYHDRSGRFTTGGGGASIPQAVMSNDKISLSDKDTTIQFPITKKEHDTILSGNVLFNTDVPKGYEGYTEMSGLFDYKTNTVSVFKLADMKKQGQYKTFYHELGNAMNFNAGGGKLLTRNKKISDAIKINEPGINVFRMRKSAETNPNYKWINKYSDKQLAQVLRGGVMFTYHPGTIAPVQSVMVKSMLLFLSDPGEVFAEGFSQYKMDPKGFSQRAPEMSSVLKEMDL